MSAPVINWDGQGYAYWCLTLPITAIVLLVYGVWIYLGKKKASLEQADPSKELPPV
jgi:hypothetical protein